MNFKLNQSPHIFNMEKIAKGIGSKLSDFEILSELGRGSYGVVFKVKSKLDENIYVIKRLDLKHMKEKAQKEAWKEAMILKNLNHPNIIKYFLSFLEEENLYIVMEYAEGGDLYSLLKSFKHKKKLLTEEELWRFAYEILLALEYLHNNNIIHRDIKCLNIFLTKDKIIKIGDLGVSKIVANIDALIASRVGTPLYLSPELIKQRPYDFKVDLWALGCTLFHLATLEPPFSGENLIVLGNNIVKTKQKALSSNFSTNFINLVEGLLSKKPEMRPSIKSLLEQVPINIKEDYERKIKAIYKKRSVDDKNINNYERIDEVVKNTAKEEGKLFQNEKTLVKESKDNKANDVKPLNLASNDYLRPKIEDKLDSKRNNANINNNNNVTNKTQTIDINIPNNNNNQPTQNPEKILEQINNIIKEVKTNPNLQNMAVMNIIKESSKETNTNICINDRIETNKSSSQYKKNELSLQNRFSLGLASPKKMVNPIFDDETSKGFFSSKNRLLSSKGKKSVQKNDFRPNTASMNRNIVVTNIKSDECNPTHKQTPTRPLTAVVKGKSHEKNIINININFYKIDLNQKYFDPTNTKSLLYINENIFKTDNQMNDKLFFSKENVKPNICKTSRISSTRIPELNQRNNYPVKVTDQIIKEGVPKVFSNKALEIIKEGTITKESFRNALINKGKNRPSTSNEFMFKNILNSMETAKDRKKLTINDFK